MERSATTDPLVGQLLDGRYRVGGRIARGGMATVYEATDLRLDRLIAIKVMPHALADDEEFSQRFVREARAAARLTHPNVVAVYDQGDDHGTLFLAMEFVAGRHTLRDVIRDEAPLPPRRALALLEEILKAIAAAHESGIIHRDIKPENVLIDPRGQVKVTDFGLARAISAATAATATGGVLMGTVSYLPPELVTDGTADARSDVYALGVLLFELLTGTKPHAGDTPIQVAYKHVHDDVPAPSSIVDGIPRYVDAFVARATARERDLRPADAHVMLQQLRRVRHALDNGVLDDEELTADLTPTLAVVSRPLEEATREIGEPGDVAAALVRQPPDEVFDFSRYDDFAPAAHPGPAFVPVSHPPRPPAPVAAERAEWPRHRRGGWIALIVVLLLAAGAAATGYYFGFARFRPTPDVITLSESAAARTVEHAGLTFEISDTAYSEKIPEGHVIATDPGAGDRVRKHGTVSAVISKGPERHDVPDLGRMNEANAVDAITANALTVAPIRRVWSESVGDGDVISFRPKAGTELRRDDAVHLVVSKGPAPIQVPDHTGDSADDADAHLEQLGFVVDRHARYSDEVAEGLVIHQSPKSGVGHAKDHVKLVVSKGPHLVEVPDVKSYGVQDAQEALESAGFDVDVRRYEPYLGVGYVVSQSPGGGAMAPYGSTIVVNVI